MPVFQIGARAVEYTLHRSATIKRASMTVTPRSLELTVPESATDAQVAAVLHRRRAWILETVDAMKAKLDHQPRVYRFETGAKIPYRGRMTRLTVEPFDGTLVEIGFRNGFVIRKPAALAGELSDILIESALRLWLKRRIRDDANDIVRRQGERHGLKPRGIQIKEQKHMWGSCGQDRQVNLNWRLIFAPKPVLEYAVVHELCHLRHRNHEPEFWALVGSILPDFEVRKAWLDANEHMLGWEKVGQSGWLSPFDPLISSTSGDR